MTVSIGWCTARVAADHLCVSERTLLRWRLAGLLRPGEHFRRKFLASTSPILYQVELCEQAMIAAFARDIRTLERAEG